MVLNKKGISNNNVVFRYFVNIYCTDRKRVCTDIAIQSKCGKYCIASKSLNHEFGGFAQFSLKTRLINVNCSLHQLTPVILPLTDNLSYILCIMSKLEYY